MSKDRDYRSNREPNAYVPPPFMKCFPQDMLNDERLRWASLAAKGAVVWLWCHQWVSEQNCIPTDPRKLCHMLGCDRAELDAVLPVVREFFGDTPPAHMQDIILATRRSTVDQKQEHTHNVRSSSGRIGGLAKAAKDRAAREAAESEP